MANRIRTSSPLSDGEEEIRKRLRSYRTLVSKHDACIELFESLFPKVTQKFSDEPRGGQVEMFEIESIVDQRIDLERQMARSLHDMQVEITSIIALLKPLPADEYTVLLRRYTLAESWEDIAKAMNYCESHVRRKHDRGITRVSQNMSRNEQS